MLAVDGAELSHVAISTISTILLEKVLLPVRLKVRFDGIRKVLGSHQPGVRYWAACG